MHRAVPASLCLVLLATATPAAAADDPGAPLQWGMARIGAEAAWATGQGAGTTIAVIDTGIDIDHEDLTGRVLPGRDLVDDDDIAQDEEGHGTHVAGVAAAASGNGLGVIGVAPEALLLPVRVLDASGQGTLEDVAAGVRWATEQAADVINLSLGPERRDLEPHPTSAAALREAIDDAWAAGIVIVLAAGNDETLGLTDSSPAIVVAATDRADQASKFAADADNDLGDAAFGMAAPGGQAGDTVETCATAPSGILSTYRADGGGSYACLAGTSMAAPHVAGAAAVLLGLGLDPVATRDRLLATAVDLGAPGPDPVYGAGRLDVTAAVAGGGMAPPPADRAPGPPVQPGVTGSSTGSATVVPGEQVGTDGDRLRRDGGAPAGAPVALDGLPNQEPDGIPPAPALVAAALIVVVAGGGIWSRRANSSA
ncbi:MAG: S8 family serine peptidase [Acidimicrobiales bacterium]